MISSGPSPLRSAAVAGLVACAVTLTLALGACGSSAGTPFDRATKPSNSPPINPRTSFGTGYLQVLESHDGALSNVVSIYSAQGEKLRRAQLPGSDGIAIASYRDCVLYGGTGRVSLVDSATGVVRTIPVRGEVLSTDPVLATDRRYASRFVALDIDEGVTDQLLDLEAGRVIDLAKAVDDPDSGREAGIVTAYVSPDTEHVLLSNGTQTVLVRTAAPDSPIRLADAAVPGGFTSSGKAVLTTRSRNGAVVSLVDPDTGRLTELPGASGPGGQLVLARAVGDRVAVVTGRTVAVFDASARHVGTAPLPVEAEYVDELADGTHLLVHSGYQAPADWALVDVGSVQAESLPALHAMTRAPGPRTGRYLLFQPGSGAAVIRAGAVLDGAGGRVTTFRLPAGGTPFSASADGSVQVLQAATTVAGTYVISAATGTVTAPPIQGSVSSSPDGSRFYVLQGREQPALLTDAGGKPVAQLPAGSAAWTART